MPACIRTISAMMSLIFGIACGIFLPSMAVGELEDVIQEPELEAAIGRGLASTTPRIVAALESGVLRVADDAPPPSVLEATAGWYLAVLDKLDETISLEDQEDAFRETWIVLRRAEASLQSPAAEDRFGNARFHLIAGSQDARSHIVGLARLHLPRDQFQRLRTITIEEERRRRLEDPGHQQYFDYGSHVESGEVQGIVHGLAARSERAFHAVPGSDLAEGALRQTFSVLGGAVRLPGLAVGGVAEGLGTATGGLGGIEHFSVTLRQLPVELRENTELILADENYKATLQSVDGLTESISGVAQAVDKLPEEIRDTIDKLEQSQPELQKTIQESDIAIRNVEAVLAQAERASQTIESTIRAAGETAEIAARFIPEAKPEPSEPKEPPEPFRMESVTEAAGALEGTIAELRATLLTLHDLIKEPQIPALAATAATESKGLVDHGALVSRSIVDHVALRLWLLLAGCLILLILHQIARHMVGVWLETRKPQRGGGAAA